MEICLSDRKQFPTKQPHASEETEGREAGDLSLVARRTCIVLSWFRGEGEGVHFLVVGFGGLGGCVCGGVGDDAVADVVVSLAVGLPVSDHFLQTLHVLFETLDRRGGGGGGSSVGADLDALDVAEEVDDLLLPAQRLAAGEQIPAHARLRHDLALVVAVEQIAQRLVRARPVDHGLQKLENVVCPPIDDGHAHVHVGMVAVAALVDLAAARRDDVGRVEILVHGVRLAGVDHEEDLMVPPLFPHLRKRVGDVPRADFLAVLELEELVAAVARQVDEDVAARVGLEALARGDVGGPAVREQPDEVLDCDLVASVVDLDVGTVEIGLAIGVGVHSAREGVAGVAGHVIG